MNFLRKLSIHVKFIVWSVFAILGISTISIMYVFFSKAEYQDINNLNELVALEGSLSDFNALSSQLPNIADSDFKFYKYGENDLVIELQELEEKIASDITHISKHKIIIQNKLSFRVNSIYSKFDRYGLQVFHIIELLKQRGNTNTGLIHDNIANSLRLFNFGQRLVRSPKVASEFVRFLHYQKLYYISGGANYQSELNGYLNNIAFLTTQNKTNEIHKLLSSKETKELDALVEKGIEILKKLNHLQQELAPDQKTGAWQAIHAFNIEIQAELRSLKQDYQTAVSKKQSLRHNLLFIVVVLFLVINAILTLLFHKELKVTLKYILSILDNVHNVSALPAITSLPNTDLQLIHQKAEQISADRKNNFDTLTKILDQTLEVDKLQSDSALGYDTLLRLQQHLNKLRNESERQKREEKISSWQIEGQTAIEAIFRVQEVQILDLSKKLVKTLVDFLEVNQGALFLLDEQENILKLFAAYSFGKFKAINQNFELGEGLIGSCALERKAIYVTDVPTDYFKIHSGLGQAHPKCIYLMPLTVENKLYGVLELASFQLFEPHELKLLETLSINIGSGFARIKTTYESELLSKKIKKRSEDMQVREAELHQELAASKEKNKGLEQTVIELTQQKSNAEDRLIRSKSNEELIHMEVLKYQEIIKKLKNKG